MSALTVLAFALLVTAGFGFGFRLVRGPSLADRVVAVDGLLIVGISAIVVDAAHTGSGRFLPIGVVTALIGYISTAVVARFIEGRAVNAEESR